jgi:hypothetical protein
MSTIRVRHLIAALESLEEPAAKINARFEESTTPRVYSMSIENIKEMLNDESEFHQDDPIIEINSVG